MQVQGKIIKVGETKSYGDKGFKKRELVVNETLEINGKQYDNPLTIIVSERASKNSLTFRPLFLLFCTPDVV